MRASIIAAIAKNGVIGKENTLPWKLPADLKRFKKITIGHTVVMGRKTYESIGGTLKKRINIVLTRQPDYQAPGCLVIHAIEEVFEKAKTEEIFFIGGAEIYKQALPMATRLYMTIINHDFEGDSYFPPLNWWEWVEIDRQQGKTDEKNPYEFCFLTFEKKY